MLTEFLAVPNGQNDSTLLAWIPVVFEDYDSAVDRTLLNARVHMPCMLSGGNFSTSGVHSNIWSTSLAPVTARQWKVDRPVSVKLLQCIRAFAWLHKIATAMF